MGAQQPDLRRVPFGQAHKAPSATGMACLACQLDRRVLLPRTASLGSCSSLVSSDAMQASKQSQDRRNRCLRGDVASASRDRRLPAPRLLRAIAAPTLSRSWPRPRTSLPLLGTCVIGCRNPIEGSERHCQTPVAGRLNSQRCPTTEPHRVAMLPLRFRSCCVSPCPRTSANRLPRFPLPGWLGRWAATALGRQGCLRIRLEPS